MRKLIYILFLFTFIGAHAETWYVQDTAYNSNASDSNTGNDIDYPWKTWGKAFNASALNPGDTVYFRGGIYYKHISEGENSWYYPSKLVANHSGYGISVDGTEGNPIYFLAYPDETPILDCSTVVYPVGVGNTGYGIRANAVNYLRFTGLHMRNVYNCGANSSNIAWQTSGTDVIFTECVVYNIHGTAQESSGAYDFYYINCDSYNCIDTLWTYPGEQGYGFATYNQVTQTGSVTYKGCRAWMCSDHGYGAGSISYVEYDSCWAFGCGLLDAGGHGFKFGIPSGSWETLEPQRLYKNNISALNRNTGYNTNDGGYPAQAMNVYNNIAYKNGWGYVGGCGFIISGTTSSEARELLRVYRNNLCYDNAVYDIFEVNSPSYTHSNNTFDAAVTVTDADFEVTPDSATIYNLMVSARQSNGSLPDLNGNLHLIKGSDLINAGVNVGLPYNGSAPDIGAFEYVNPQVLTGDGKFTISNGKILHNNE